MGIKKEIEFIQDTFGGQWDMRIVPSANLNFGWTVRCTITNLPRTAVMFDEYSSPGITPTEAVKAAVKQIRDELQEA